MSEGAKFTLLEKGVVKPRIDTFSPKLGNASSPLFGVGSVNILRSRAIGNKTLLDFWIYGGS